MTATLAAKWKQPAFLAGVAVVVAAGVLYLATLDNGLRVEELIGGDLITHQYAQVEARPSNAPGYPLYTMGGWLWFHALKPLLSPWLNPIQILSSYSTLWALLALGVLYVLLLDVTGGNWAVSGLCTLFYAVTYFFWYYSVTTEQYTSAVLQTLLMVLWAFRWERGGDDRYLLLLALMVGLCLANLITVLFVLPPIAIFILTAEPRLLRRGKLIVRGAALALLPLLSYAYVYLRGAQHPEWWGAGQWPNAWAWFVSFVSTQQGRDELTWALGPFTAEFPWLIPGELTWVVLVVGLVGWALLGRRRAGVLYGSLAIYLAFCYVDRYGNWYQVFMPMYPLIVLGLAVAADRLWRAVSRPPARGLIALGLVALIGYRFAASLPRADQSDLPTDTGLDPGWAILADDPAPGAAVVCDEAEYLALDYLTAIWGLRPDVEPIGADGAAGVWGTRPLYTTRTMAAEAMGRLSPVHPSSQGLTLIALHRQPQTAIPAMQHTLHAEVGGRLRLLGYDGPESRSDRAWSVLRPPVTDRRGAGRVANPTGHITLYWQAVAPMDEDYALSVRPTRHGQPITVNGQLLQHDTPHPVWGTYPTSRWTLGEVVRDDHLFPIPTDGEYDGVRIVVYRAVGGGFEDVGVVDIRE